MMEARLLVLCAMLAYASAGECIVGLVVAVAVAVAVVVVDIVVVVAVVAVVVAFPSLTLRVIWYVKLSIDKCIP